MIGQRSGEVLFSKTALLYCKNKTKYTTPTANQNSVCSPCMPESTVHSHAPEARFTEGLGAAGNHVNASHAIRLQLKHTLSETNI